MKWFTEYVLKLKAIHSSLITNFKHKNVSNHFLQHCKSFAINSINLFYKEGLHTVRNKGDLDSVIKTKTSILALKSYLNML